MFVITADQVGSRTDADRVRAALEHLNAAGGLALPAERTAGDELQLVAEDAAAALAVILHLDRVGRWSVGCGIGPVEAPLPASTREAWGPAFVAARSAVERAKGRTPRAVIVSAVDGAVPSAADLQAVLDLLLLVRERRSAEGWELHDLLGQGLSQAEAAARLGITPQAASKRARAAQLRADRAVTVALARLMDAHDRAASGRDHA